MSSEQRKVPRHVMLRSAQGDNSPTGSGEARVLVIGLDGATFDLLKPLAAKGIMPNLSRFMSSGFQSVLQSTVPPITAAAWTTFITGKNPGKHGILQFVDIRPSPPTPLPNRERGWGKGGIEVFPGGFSVLNARSIRERTLWQLISEAGKRLIVINVPMTYPPTPLHGLMIACMLTPPGAKDFTYPPSLAERLPGYEIDLALHEREFGFPADAFLDRLFAVTEKRFQACLRLMGEEAWDFFMVVFTGTDRIQHRFWRYLDENAPEYNAPQARRLRPRLEGYYHRLDAMIGELMHRAGKETLTIVLSDHGFGPMARFNVYKSALLRELGLAPARGNWAVLLRATLERFGFSRDRIYRIIGRILPRRWLAGAMQRVRDTERRTWREGAAFIPTLHSYIGGLAFNEEIIKKRFSLTTEESYERFRQAVKAKLEDLRDPLTGGRIVSRVAWREELYQGPRVDEFPDLIFLLGPQYMLVGGRGRTGRLVEAKTDEPERQGSHRAEGILLVSGPGVQQATGRSEAGLADVSVTLLYALGIPIPTDMDGKVIAEAFAPAYLDSYPIAYQEPSGSKPVAGSTDELWESVEDAQKVEDRLRGLGYID